MFYCKIMRERNNITKFSIVLITLFLLLTILPQQTSSTSPVEPPNVVILFPKININYIENNIGELENISVILNLVNNYVEERKFHLKFLDNTSNIIIDIRVNPKSRREIRIYSNSYSNISSPPYLYNFSNNISKFLLRIIETDASNVLSLIQNTSFSNDYNEFYPFNPLQSSANYWDVGPSKIDETWYFAAHSYPTLSLSRYQTFAMIFLVFCLVSISFFTFFGLLYKKLKKRYFLAIMLLSIILAIIFLFLCVNYLGVM